MTKLTLIHGARVVADAQAADRPGLCDVLIDGSRILDLAPGLAATLADLQGGYRVNGRPVEVCIDARDQLMVPGFVNAHYHSHDVLLKGCFEAIPRETWLLNALPPNYPRRPPAEIRARTLLGALECLRSGITTVQDMLTVDLAHPEDLETAVDAYAEIGIRCVLGVQTGDVHGAAVTPFWADVMPSEALPGLGGVVGSGSGTAAILAALEAQIETHAGRSPTLGWGLAPSSPERASPALLAGLATLAARRGLRVFTHVYESRATTVIGRQRFGAWGGSLIEYLDAHGLLGPQVTLAHGVWMRRAEIDRIAERGAALVLNPVGNLKTQSGVAPIAEYADAGITLGLGCDNCSCGDAQNMFQVMKAFAGLAAVSSTRADGVTASQALAAATVGGAAALGLADEIGALRPGSRADLSLLDLAEPAFMPLNSAVRQLVFSEAGAAVNTVLVDGRVVLRDRRPVSIDAARLRQSVEHAMEALRETVAQVVARHARLRPYLLEAHARTTAYPLEIDRYVPGLDESDAGVVTDAAGPRP